MTVAADPSAGPGQTVSAPSDWGFVCGRVAALATGLLPEAAFGTLARAKTLGEFQGLLARTPYQAVLASAKTAAAAGAALGAYFAEARSDLFALTPDHPLKAYFGLLARYRSFRVVFNQTATRAGTDGAALAETFSLLATDGDGLAALSAHRARAERIEDLRAAMPEERSLFLDSAACVLMDAYGRRTPEALAQRFIRGRAALSAWAVLVRACGHGVAPETLRAWFMLDGSGSEGLVESVLAHRDRPAAAVSPWVGAETGRALERIDTASIKADVDTAAATALRDTVVACRRVALGPERVLAYGVALEAEEVNIRLCLEAVAGDLDRDGVAARLRRGYGD